MGFQIETIVDGIQGSVFRQAHGDVGEAHLVGEGDGRLAGLTVGALPQDVPMAALVTTSWVCAMLGAGNRSVVFPQIPAPQRPHLSGSFLDGLLGYTGSPMSLVR
jgi:hypothetical protein